MKKIILTFILGFLFFAEFTIAQAPPNAFNYSAVARNSSGTPISSKKIGIQISILKSSSSGSAQYIENHFVDTDVYGLFNLVIGDGAVQSGNMDTINWSNDKYYIKVGMDANGGTTFLTMGTSQLLSVPYALYAKHAGSLSGVSASLITPTVKTYPVTGITSNSATLSGNVSNAVNGQIIERGFVYSTEANPNLSSNKIVTGRGVGTFDTTTLNDFRKPHFLQMNTLYFVRAYALTENNLIFYGNEVSFTTAGSNPPGILTSVSDITSNYATFGGVISNANGNSILANGFVYSSSPNPTYNVDKTIGAPLGSGAFQLSLEDRFFDGYILDADTTYFVRAFVISGNNVITYGDEIKFTTLSIGQTGSGGGIVFFNKGNNIGGWQYLEVAKSDQSNGIAWGCSGKYLEVHDYKIGTGEANTAKIVAGCTQTNFAAKLCDDLILGGQNDWFLPSDHEWRLISKNLYEKGKGNFSTDRPYWISVEQDEYNAEFHTYGGWSSTSKTNQYLVRAIRAY